MPARQGFTSYMYTYRIVEVNGGTSLDKLLYQPCPMGVHSPVESGCAALDCTVFSPALVDR